MDKQNSLSDNNDIICPIGKCFGNTVFATAIILS